MTAAIYHRGPDDEGFYADGSVALGMRRLSIIDLDTGRQPIHNEDRTIWTVFNGEIYNFRELRQELASKGHAFETKSDTEVIVHAYEEWRDDCPLHMNGIFAYAVWDERGRRVLLARDHFGVKPLYFYDDGSRLLFASEIKAILSDRTIPREVNEEALDLFLTFRFVPSPFTMFRGIQKVPPGHRLVAENGKVRLERYWSPRPVVDRTLTEQDYVESLRERLHAAVRRQMVSDVPLGALLSGGIDSSVVVAIMSELAHGPVKTFTVGFVNGGGVNELKEARETAHLFGTDHHEIVLGQLDFRDFLAKAVWHLDEPIATTSALALYFVCKLAREHVTVVLTGQGADEPFAGYHRYVGERYGSVYRAVPSVLRKSLLQPAMRLIPRHERWKRAARSLEVQEPNERFAEVYAVFPRDLKARLYRNGACSKRWKDGADVVGYWRRDIEHLDPLSQMTYVDARLSLADDLLLYGDKMSMAASIEARVPFLDLELMDVAEALPGNMRIRGLTRKYVHKKVVAKWLPREIVRRPKKGFDTPMDRWFQDELNGYVTDLLLGKDAAVKMYFEPSTIQQMINAHATRREDYQRQLFSLLTFEIWHRVFMAGVEP